MALRLLSPGRRTAVLYGHTLRQISASLRQLSTKDDVESDGEPVITVRQVHASAGELLGDTDRRLPLPGRVGLAEQLSPPPPPPPLQPPPPGGSAAAELFHDRHTAALFSLLTPSNAAAGEEPPAPSVASATDTVVLEIEAHQCPQLLKQEFQPLFRERDITRGPLTVLVVSQRTEEDMSVWSETVQEERDQLAQHFMSVAGDIVMRLRRRGFWADLVDPRTGRPHLGGLVPPRSDGGLADDGEEPDQLIETDRRMATLGFTIEDLGCCKVVRHAVWGCHVFIGCMFTNAALEDPQLSGVISRYQDLPV